AARQRQRRWDIDCGAVRYRSRQPGLEAASMPRLALHVHRSVMVMNDLVRSREAEPGSRQAGREERLEQSSRHALVEPASAVDDSQAHVAARRKLAMAHLDGSGHVLLLRGHADGSVAL